MVARPLLVPQCCEEACVSNDMLHRCVAWAVNRRYVALIRKKKRRMNPVQSCRTEFVQHTGGATPRFWTPTTPPTNCWPEAPWGGGGGGGGDLSGGLREGEWGGV